MERYLASFHRALAELDTLGFDAEAIFSWAHAEDPLYRRNRKQLIASMPALAVILAAEPSIPILMELAAVIDRGNPHRYRVQRTIVLNAFREGGGAIQRQAVKPFGYRNRQGQ